jgi:hypothetical protein
MIIVAERPVHAARAIGDQATLAERLDALGDRLGSLGRREEGLAAIEEAVTIRRELGRGAARGVPARPRDVFEHLSARLGELVRREKGVVEDRPRPNAVELDPLHRHDAMLPTPLTSSWDLRQRDADVRQGPPEPR